ncbi:MAG TPA: hypothetical protein VGH80_00330 [Xanthomonadaceae bacterium]|jgi:hypothetical protein
MNDVNASSVSSVPEQRKGRAGDVIGGLVLILIGLVFLADNFNIDLPLFGWHNWWALFILVGAAAPASRAIDRYRSVGAFDAQVAHSLLSAAAVVAVALIFLLDASFGVWWPIFLVIGGLSMLVSGGRRRDRR